LCVKPYEWIGAKITRLHIEHGSLSCIDTIVLAMPHITSIDLINCSYDRRVNNNMRLLQVLSPLFAAPSSSVSLQHVSITIAHPQPSQLIHEFQFVPNAYRSVEWAEACSLTSLMIPSLPTIVTAPRLQHVAIQHCTPHALYRLLYNVSQIESVTITGRMMQDNDASNNNRNGNGDSHDDNADDGGNGMAILQRPFPHALSLKKFISEVVTSSQVVPILAQCPALIHLRLNTSSFPAIPRVLTDLLLSLPLLQHLHIHDDRYDDDEMPTSSSSVTVTTVDNAPRSSTAATATATAAITTGTGDGGIGLPDHIPMLRLQSMSLPCYPDIINRLQTRLYD
jgi:hypothetical protein